MEIVIPIRKVRGRSSRLVGKINTSIPRMRKSH
jgi:hypothetical protein